jgi:hypothetical protein
MLGCLASANGILEQRLVFGEGMVEPLNVTVQTFVHSRRPEALEGFRTGLDVC